MHQHDKEEYEDRYNRMQNMYFYFMQTVSCLTKSAEEQCDIVGNFNVAYELALEAKVVDCLIDQNYIKFTDKEIKQMTSFLHSLEGLEPPFLGSGGSRDENIANMRDYHWDSVREEAKKLEAILREKTEANLKYFK